MYNTTVQRKADCHLPALKDGKIFRSFTESTMIRQKGVIKTCSFLIVAYNSLKSKCIRRLNA